jgi:hypothetical protein
MSFSSTSKTLVILVWLIAVGWLIRFQAFPHWLEETARGYEALTRDLPALRDSWLKVFSGDQHVGYVHSSTQIEEIDSTEQLALNSQMVLRLRLNGEERILRLTSDVRLNAQSEFLNSNLKFSVSNLVNGEMTLIPEENDTRFRLSLEVNPMGGREIRLTRLVEVPDDVIVASPLLDNGLISLRPGQTLRIRTLDPFSADGSTRTLVLRGERDNDWKNVTLDGETLEVRKVSMTLGDIRLNAWLDEYGRTLRQETPFGLTLVYSDSRRAVQIPDENMLDFHELLNGSPLSSFSRFPVTP